MRICIYIYYLLVFLNTRLAAGEEDFNDETNSKNPEKEFQKLKNFIEEINKRYGEIYVERYKNKLNRSDLSVSYLSSESFSRYIFTPSEEFMEIFRSCNIEILKYMHDLSMEIYKFITKGKEILSMLKNLYMEDINNNKNEGKIAIRNVFEFLNSLIENNKITSLFINDLITEKKINVDKHKKLIQEVKEENESLISIFTEEIQKNKITEKKMSNCHVLAQFVDLYLKSHYNMLSIVFNFNREYVINSKNFDERLHKFLDVFNGFMIDELKISSMLKDMDNAEQLMFFAHHTMRTTEA